MEGEGGMDMCKGNMSMCNTLNPPRQGRAARYQAFPAVDGELQDEPLQRDDESQYVEEYYDDQRENAAMIKYDGDFDDYTLVEPEEGTPPKRGAGRCFGRGYRRSRGTLICRHCGGQGHFARDCATPARRRRR